MLQSKGNLSLLVSCFYPFGNHLHMDLRNAYLHSFPLHFSVSLNQLKHVSMTTFGSRLSTCYKVLQKERLLTYGVDRPGQSGRISPLQGGHGRDNSHQEGVLSKGICSILRMCVRVVQLGLTNGWILVWNTTWPGSPVGCYFQVD